MAKGSRRSIIGPGGLPARSAAAAPAGPRTTDLAPMSLRAMLDGEGDEEKREVGLVFTTGAPVERFDWSSGERYLETLSLDPDHVRLGRLNQGGPLLDSHSAFSVSDMLGAVVPGSVSLTKKEGRARVRFSKREAVAPVWQDVRDGLIKDVSIGYRVYAYEVTEGKGNKLPIRKAIDWEPFEVSMVPIPADAGASIRGQKPADTNQCQIVTRAETAAPANPKPQGAEPAPPKERAMDPQKPEYVVEDDPLEQPTRSADPASETEPNDRDLGVRQERERVEGIRQACEAARLPREFESRLIADSTMTLVRAQGAVFDELKKRDRDDRGPGRIPSGVTVGEDPFVHKREAMLQALLHRVAPAMRAEDGKPRFPLTDQARHFRGLGVIDMARVFLHARGERTTHLSKMEILARALGPGAVFIHSERTDSSMDVRSGMHTTSDFANLLADVQGKVLRAAYSETPQTWMPLSRRVVLTDFKPSKQIQFGEGPALEEVLEHGEFTRGTIGESKEQFQLATYGRIFSVTRQALINDDLDAFARVATEFGRSARRKENALAWAQIVGNPTMGDGNSLFDASNHANYTSSGTAIGIDSLGVGRAALRKQTGVDGSSVLNLSARFLIVSAAKETLADQYTSANFVPSAAGSVNPFAGRLVVIAEPILDADDPLHWYLAASPDQIDILLHGVLEGQEGPAIETRVGFDVDGLEVKCRIDTAFKAADWRGLYKNAGA